MEKQLNKNPSIKPSPYDFVGTRPKHLHQYDKPADYKSHNQQGHELLDYVRVHPLGGGYLHLVLIPIRPTKVQQMLTTSYYRMSLKTIVLRCGMGIRYSSQTQNSRAD